MRARVRKDATLPTVRKAAPTVPWSVRVAGTLPRGARVSNPLLGEEPAGTVAVFDLGMPHDLEIFAKAEEADAALFVDAEPWADHLLDRGFALFTVEGDDTVLAANFKLPEAPWLSITKAAKYDHIDFRPPQGVANAAAKGLEYRKKAGGKGGLSTSEAAEQGVGSGVARAASLKNRQNQSPDTVRRMKAFFDRHEGNKGVDPKYKGEPWKDRGHVAWLLWGGDPGRSWANKIVGQMNAADEKAEKGLKVEVEVEICGDDEPEMAPVLKHFAGFENFDACVLAQTEAGHSEETARAICGALQAEAEKKGELSIGPGDPGYLQPEQGNRYRRVRTKDALIIGGIGLLTKSAVEIEKQPEEGEDERYILGVVLEPDEVDSQGDTISAEEIRRAAHGYMEKFGNVGLQHQTFVNDKIKILETYLAPVDFQIGDETVKAGTWLMAFRILDDSIWKAVKEGLLTGLSIGGTGLRLALA